MLHTFCFNEKNVLTSFLWSHALTVAEGILEGSPENCLLHSLKQIYPEVNCTIKKTKGGKSQ